MVRPHRRHAVLRITGCLVALGCLTGPRVGRAQGVTFDEAIFSSEAGPAALAPRRELAAREEADAKVRGTAQALTITAMPGLRWRPDEERGFEGQWSVTQGWNLAGLGAARREAAAEERHALTAEVRAVALALRLEAARLWIELHTLERWLEAVSEQVELARETQEIVRRGVEAGVGTLADLADAESFEAEVVRARFSVEGKIHETSLELAVAMGREPTSDLRTEGPAPAPEIPSRASLDSRLERAGTLPRAEALRLAALAARAREREDRALMGPLMAVGAQVQNEPPSAWTAMGSLGLSLNPFDRGMRARAIALGEAARLEQEHAAAQLRAQAELRDAAHDVEHTRRDVAVIEESWLPSVTRLVERRRGALTAGVGTTFELLAARRSWVAVRGLLARALGARTWAEVRLWLLLAELERGGGAP
jgi:outer membrane protein, heavy metal efflux system